MKALYCLGMAVWRGQILVVEKKKTITKEHPALWNFPGGLVNKDEKPRVAMSREVLEETGVPIFQHNWVLMGRLIRHIDGGKIQVNCYRTQESALHEDHSFDTYKGSHRSEWIDPFELFLGKSGRLQFMPDLQALTCLMWGDFAHSGFVIQIP